MISPTFKVIIAGTRTFTDFQLLCKHCDKILSRKSEIEIVCGGADGADKLGKVYALKNLHGLKEFRADWGKYGKAAGPIRNEGMAKYADACIVFWDGKSRGSKSMIALAKKYGLKLRVIYY